MLSKATYRNGFVYLTLLYSSKPFIFQLRVVKSKVEKQKFTPPVNNLKAENSLTLELVTPSEN